MRPYAFERLPESCFHLSLIRDFGCGTSQTLCSLFPYDCIVLGVRRHGFRRQLQLY